MKSLSKEQANTIFDLYQEQRKVHISALEKDIHVTDVIKEIASMKSPHFDIVFCGGTCLSKAYGILERMSEDIDFKIVAKSTYNPISKSEAKKDREKLRDNVLEILVNNGYLSKEDLENDKGKPQKDREISKARDEYNYNQINVKYKSENELSEVLRDARVQVELNFTTMQMSSVVKSVGYIYKELIADSSKEVEISCISLEEAFCEKLISFPRRLALFNVDQEKQNELRSECEKNGIQYDSSKARDFDKTLVRHIYDVYQIKLKYPNIDTDTQQMNNFMRENIRKDALDFKGQHEAFTIHPINELMKAMDSAKNNAEIKIAYEQFVIDMVYSDSTSTPSFADALNVFEKALKNSTQNIVQQKQINKIKPMGPTR
jgi:predicted nucleotidyltransferase component of viral defense system